MIALHRLAHADEPYHLNPDLIVSVEAHPDTVVTLTTGTKVLVVESPEEIADAVRAWRASVLGVAMRDLPRRSAALTLVRAAAGEDQGSPS
ncbi:MAG: flagellar FlbD family protein [Actinomycetota bacterium]|nr:flagellar FlbD family protein [Actinomycetota bacterium]